MASNPMQRKSRLAFILGMLVTVLIAAVIIFVLMLRVKKAQKETEDLRASLPQMVTVWVATEKIPANTEFFKLDPDSQMPTDVTQTMIYNQQIPANLLTSDVTAGILSEESYKKYLDYLEDVKDEQDTDSRNERIDNRRNEMVEDEDEEESETIPIFKALIDIEPGTIITTSMIVKNPEIFDNLRSVEYNMLSLPSELEAGQYIDIRFALPNGGDYIVASKKYVKQANSSTIWLDLAEKDMLTINYAIIESYIVEGSKLYAVMYTDSTQEELSTTYIPSNETIQAVIANGGVFTAANGDVAELMQATRSTINSLIERKTDAERTTAIESGFSAEKSALKSAREEFLGEMGY